MAPKRDAADRDAMTSIDLGIGVIDAYLENLRRRGCTDATLRHRRTVLLAVNRALPGGIGQTTDEEIATWLFRDGWSENTRATYDRALRSFYAFAADPRDAWIDFDPMRGLPRPVSPVGVPRPCTDEQLGRILNEARQPFRLWSVVAAYQGLRGIEIARLDREHVTERTLHVVRGKGNRPRVHDTDSYVWAAVKDLPPGPVAIWRGRRATAHEVCYHSAQEFDRLGLPDVTLHRLRHWLGVTVQRLYRNMRVTQAVLGHASLSSTQIYTDATAEELRAARATLPRPVG